jgi:hypothetical protein
MLMKTNQREEKKFLTRKLLSYSAAAGALLAVGSDAEAQVKYTDVDPDAVVVLPTERGTRDSLSVDLNGDGIIDVNIMAGNGDKWGDTTNATNTSNWMSIRAKPAPGGEVNIHPSYLADWGETYNFANRFDAEDLLGPDLGEGDYWSGGAESFMLGWLGVYQTGGTYNTGPWTDGETDKYLGIRFTLDEGVSYHYGWIRLDVPSDQSQVTIKDYAYEQTADKAIVAGDMGSGTSVRDGLKNDLGVKLFSLDRNIIVSDLKVDQARAEVYNISGQLVRSVQVEKGRTEIPMESTGIFIVKIDMGAEIVSSKVIVR